MKVLGWGHLQEIGRVPPPEFAMPRVAPAARDELQLLTAELARGAKHIKGAYWATEAEWARAESGEEIGITLDDRLACDLEHGGVKMQFNRSCQSMTMCDMGSLELFCRIGSGAPFHLFQVGGGEFRTDGDEATPAQYKRLMKKLGLKHSTRRIFWPWSWPLRARRPWRGRRSTARRTTSTLTSRARARVCGSSPRP